MVAKVVKLAAVPTALGLASFRVYAMKKEKKDGQIPPRELSIYSAEPPELRCVEEKPGHLQTRLGQMRVGLQPYVKVVQNTCTSVQVGAVSLYQAGEDTYHFLRDPNPGFLPRVGVITVSGLAGLILARKGSRLKRLVLSLGLMTAGAAVCYPMHTVGVLKMTGKKVYAASSLVASAFKPKEKSVVPDACLKHPSEEAVIKVDHQLDGLLEKVPWVPEGESGLEDASVPNELSPVSRVSPTTTTIVVVPKASSATDVIADDVAPASEGSSTSSAAVGIPQVEVVSVVDRTVGTDFVLEELIPSGGTITPAETAEDPKELTDFKVSPAEEAPVDIAPDITPAEAVVVVQDHLAEISPAVGNTSDIMEVKQVIERLPEYAVPLAKAAPLDPEKTTPSSLSPEETTPSPLSPEETTPSPLTPEETTPSPLSPEETTPSPLSPEETTPSPLASEETTPSPFAPEETTPSSLDPEAGTSPPLAAEKTTSSPLDPKEGTTPPLAPEKTTSSPLDPEKATPSPLARKETTAPPAVEVATSQAKGKTRFVRDPSLLDHGQAHPEDADLYSTRGKN